MEDIDGEVQDLFNEGDTDEEEAAVDSDMNVATQEGNDQDAVQSDALNSRIKEKLKEIKSGAVKKRAARPRAKLDPARLTGSRGCALLPVLFKHIKLKGKGHEADDLTTMMQIMEHWAHRLFPKMTFDEIIDKIEVLGMKKAVQTYVNRIRLDLPLHDSAILSLEDSNTGTDQTSAQEKAQVTQGDGVSDPLDTEPLSLMHALNAVNSTVAADMPSSLTVEQLERMRRNREEAAARRMNAKHT